MGYPLLLSRGPRELPHRSSGLPDQRRPPGLSWGQGWMLRDPCGGPFRPVAHADAQQWAYVPPLSRSPPLVQQTLAWLCSQGGECQAGHACSAVTIAVKPCR